MYSQIGGPVAKKVLPQAPDVHDWVIAGQELSTLESQTAFGTAMTLFTQMYTKEAIAKVVATCPRDREWCLEDVQALRSKVADLDTIHQGKRVSLSELCVDPETRVQI